MCLLPTQRVIQVIESALESLQNVSDIKNERTNNAHDN